ncbi:MAG: HNH endonuclease [Chloroflexi bacterium]|nr:HNH endonuclease [Chloroflexota bacterium]
MTYLYCCGYCGVSETWAASELEVDHFRPLSRGGTDALTNLVYACASCNRFKSDYWPDDDAPDSLRLLHPSQDDLGEHIVEAANGRLAGLTPRGWFHIRWLHLNRPQLVDLRQIRQSEQLVKEALSQAQTVKTELQKRIRELEIEVAQLQETISRLTESE